MKSPTQAPPSTGLRTTLVRLHLPMSSLDISHRCVLANAYKPCTIRVARKLATVKAIEIIADPEKAAVLVDPMRREIVRLLGDGGKTENQLAEILGLSDPSVGHHLKILRDSGLIRLARQKIGQHGIVEKFYESNARIYFVDSKKMPLEIERYFMPISLERARGIIAAAEVMLDESQEFSAAEVEEFARALASAVVQLAPRFSRPWKGAREELVGRVYKEALAQLLRKRELVPQKLRALLVPTYKSKVR
jgi:DNA-binding transcriptional ArsR family regulator